MTLPLTPAQVLEVLQEHEWEFTDTRQRVACITCGKTHPARKFEESEAGELAHKDGCRYALLVAMAQRELEE
jgi:hypothetical protein